MWLKYVARGKSYNTKELDGVPFRSLSVVQVTIDAVSPRVYAQPVPPTPHANHGVLYHRDNTAPMHEGHTPRTDILRPHDRSVSFQNGCDTVRFAAGVADLSLTAR